MLGRPGWYLAFFLLLTISDYDPFFVHRGGLVPFFPSIFQAPYSCRGYLSRFPLDVVGPSRIFSPCVLRLLGLLAPSYPYARRGFLPIVAVSNRQVRFAFPVPVGGFDRPLPITG